MTSPALAADKPFIPLIQLISVRIVRPMMLVMRRPMVESIIILEHRCTKPFSVVCGRIVRIPALSFFQPHLIHHNTLF